MKKIVLFVLFGVVIAACDKSDPVIPNEEELITTVTYTLTSSTGEKVELSFKDLDGDGGQAPVITSGKLKPNTTYSGELKLWNESESPADNITLEIEEEASEHQFFFQVTGANATVTYKDKDNGGNPLGLSTELKTGAASTGQLTITLRHEPNKSASGVSQGNIANAGGETDIEVTFPLTIE